MLTHPQAAELNAFFEKYADALSAMAQDESEKLNALVSNSLPRIEQAISAAQANTKKIEGLEIKRMALQTSMGCSGMTLSQLLEQVPEPYKVAAAAFFSQIQASVDKIKFTNNKSMSIAHQNITLLNPEAPVLTTYTESAAASNPYEAARGYHNSATASIFKAKI